MEKKSFKEWFIKSHLIFLILAIGLYIMKAILYFSIKEIPVEIHHFHMRIDELIPFCKYFYVFYVSYYVVPEILLWSLSFHDKNKFWNLFIAVAIANVIACICFVIYQVQMIRPEGYPMDIGLKDVKNISDFFDFAVSQQYIADEGGLNCFPSLHATMGFLIVLLGIRTSKDEAKLPLWIRLVGIIDGIGIVLSTMFVKQHYAIDALAGCVLITAVYFSVIAIRKNIAKKKKQKEDTE